MDSSEMAPGGDEAMYTLAVLLSVLECYNFWFNRFFIQIGMKERQVCAQWERSSQMNKKYLVYLFITLLSFPPQGEALYLLYLGYRWK